jgi:hypothetical protein
MRKRKVTLTKLKIKRKMQNVKTFVFTCMLKESKYAEFHDTIIMHQTLNGVLIIILSLKV